MAWHGDFCHKYHIAYGAMVSWSPQNELNGFDSRLSHIQGMDVFRSNEVRKNN